MNVENQNQEDEAIVTEFKKGNAILEIIRGGACKTCSLSNLCAVDNSKVSIKVKTEMDLKVGDVVKIYVSPATKLFSSFLIFIFPIVSMIIFYLLGKYAFRFSENFSILFSFVGLVISGFVIYYLDKIYANKINYRIIDKIR